MSHVQAAVLQLLITWERIKQMVKEKQMYYRSGILKNGQD
jgi:hypothetical protein